MPNGYSLSVFTWDPAVAYYPPMNNEKRIPDWLSWARKLQAIAQTGLHFSNSSYDVERYEKLHEVAMEIAEMHTGKTPEELKELFYVQPGYATPRVDVRAACFRDGKILLVKERTDGRWAMPGGWADVGDTPSLATIREVKEESGYDCVARKIIGVFDANRNHGELILLHAFKVIFLCDLTGGEPSNSHDILEVGFFERDALPPLSLERNSEEQIAECFRHYDEAARPSVFD